MSDTKFTDLTAVGSALRADKFALVQSGNSRRATLSDVSKLLGPYVNVLNYGVVGGGSTDDWLAAQTLADAVGAAGGGVLFYPHGTYRHTAPLVVDKSKVYVRGESRGGSVFFSDSNAGAIFYNGGAGISYGGVSRLTIIGRQSAAQTAGSAIYLSNIGDYSLSDLAIRDSYDSIVLDGAQSGDCDNISIDETVVGASRNGVTIGDTSISNHFRHVVVVGNGVGFLLETGTDTATFDACGVQKTATAIPTHGWQLTNTGGDHDPRWVKLTHCYAEVADAGAGYYLVKGYGIDLTSCYSAWGGYGVYVNAAHNIRVTGGEYFLAQQNGIALASASCRDVGYKA
jgi:hypothetical protein